MSPLRSRAPTPTTTRRALHCERHGPAWCSRTPMGSCTSLLNAYLGCEPGDACRVCVVESFKNQLVLYFDLNAHWAFLLTQSSEALYGVQPRFFPLNPAVWYPPNPRTSLRRGVLSRLGDLTSFGLKSLDKYLFWVISRSFSVEAPLLRSALAPARPSRCRGCGGRLYQPFTSQGADAHAHI